MIKSFLDLEVYQESFQLSLEVEEIVKKFLPEEKYLLVDQMKRCSRAIPAMIAEGYTKRESLREFKKFLRDALAEANEMMNHLAFAKAKKYIGMNYADKLIERYNIVGKKLFKLKENWQSF